MGPPRSRDRELARLARRRFASRRVRAWLRRSMLPIRCAYLIAAIAAIVLGIVCTALDRHIGTRLPPGIGVDGARDVPTSAATGMIAFTGLVVSSVLLAFTGLVVSSVLLAFTGLVVSSVVLAVQFAARQYSPRLVLSFRRDQVVEHAIGSVLAAPVFARVALKEIESRVHKNNPRRPRMTIRRCPRSLAYVPYASDSASSPEEIEPTHPLAISRRNVPARPTRVRRSP